MRRRGEPGESVPFRRRLAAAVGLAAAIVVIYAAPAAAHNSLESADPADGSTRADSPPAMTLTFAKPVPLSSFGASLIAPDGSRTPLNGVTGQAENVVVVALPALVAGSWTVRWKLVGDDGHVVSDTVGFSVTGASIPSPTPGSATPGVASPAPPTTSGLAAASVTPSQSPAAIGVESASTDAFPDAGFTTPRPLSWFLRVVSFAAFVVLVGALTVGCHLWPASWGRGVLPRATAWAVIALGILSITQLFVAVADIVGQNPAGVVDDIWRSSGYWPVKAALARTAVAAVVAAIVLPIPRLLRGDLPPPSLPIAVAVVVLFAFSFSMAGHPVSLPVPALGVPLDVVHLSAAGVWLGSMIMLGPLGRARDQSELSDWRDAVIEFSPLARAGVICLVVTGILQAVRIDGTGLLSGTHGPLTLAKVSILAPLLWAADVNRRRVRRRLNGHQPISPGIAGALRRAMGTELALGGAILGVTGALVASSPA